MVKPRTPFLVSLAAGLIGALLAAAIKAIFDVTVQDYWKDTASPFRREHVGPWSATMLEWVGPYWAGFASAFLLMLIVEMGFAWWQSKRQQEPSISVRPQPHIAETSSASKDDKALPPPLVRSLADAQAGYDQMNQRLAIISAFFEQYKRLLRAAIELPGGKASDGRSKDIEDVAKFLADAGSQIIPPQPFGPDQPLIFQTGWNQYRYIFSVPMRDVPSIDFSSLPEGMYARIVSITRLDVEVKFWSGLNQDAIAPQAFFASAEL